MALLQRRREVEEKEKEPQQAGERRLDARELLAALLSGAGAPQVMGPGIVQVNLDRLLQLLRDIPLDTETLRELDPLRKEIDSTIVTLQRLGTDIISRQLSDGMSIFIHPLYGTTIVDSRLRQLSHILSESIRRMWRHIANNWEKMSGEELRVALSLATLSTKLSYLVLSELYMKLLTLYHINAPPAARPPLANAAMGYELLRQEVAPAPAGARSGRRSNKKQGR